ncbi:Zn-ribbon domain-containing OB-fold protein [Martelella soudanensis]|uniref:Zn-ribbon domain-containing OB-fold protein n=1 Tax=unclassified Martelella TaxID=2629616 RepID=UPI0015DE9360|nr:MULTISPECIES: OB-fold domain-containing protein [unclassified Martelella]
MTDLLPEGGPDRAFQTHVADGRLWLQTCADCDSAIFMPRIICPHCGSLNLAWRPASGLGTVYARTVLHNRPKPGDDRPARHALVLVDLDEGPRMMSRLPDTDPDAIAIGMRVSARITGEAGKHVVVFDPAEEKPSEGTAA